MVGRMNLKGPYARGIVTASTRPFPIAWRGKDRGRDPHGVLHLSCRLANVEGGLPVQFSLERPNVIGMTHVRFVNEGDTSRPYPYIRVRRIAQSRLLKMALTQDELRAMAAHFGISTEHGLTMVFAFSGGKGLPSRIMPSQYESFDPDYFARFMQFMNGGTVPNPHQFEIYIPHQKERRAPFFPYIIGRFVPPSWVYGKVASVTLSRVSRGAFAALEVSGRRAAFQLTEMEARRTLLPEEHEAEFFDQLRLADFFRATDAMELRGFVVAHRSKGIVLDLGWIGNDRENHLILRSANQESRLVADQKYYVCVRRDRDAMHVEVFLEDKRTLVGIGQSTIVGIIPLQNPIYLDQGRHTSTPAQVEMGTEKASTRPAGTTTSFPRRRLKHLIAGANDFTAEGWIESFTAKRKIGTSYTAISLGATKGSILLVTDDSQSLIKADKNYWVELVREDNELTIKISTAQDGELIGIGETMIVNGDVSEAIVSLTPM